MQAEYQAHSSFGDCLPSQEDGSHACKKSGDAGSGKRPIRLEDELRARLGVWRSRAKLRDWVDGCCHTGARNELPIVGGFEGDECGYWVWRERCCGDGRADL